MSDGQSPFPLALCAVPRDDAEWKELNRQAGGRDDAASLAVKAGYVYGLIHGICETVQYMLRAPNAWPVTYLPAFGVCASAVELLGRCLDGYGGIDAGPSLLRGLVWLAPSPAAGGAPPTGGRVTVVKTNHGRYTADHLVALRNFAAHGQATTRLDRIGGQAGMAFADIELLDRFPQLIGDGIERYWGCLKSCEEYCRSLARANVAPLRADPIGKAWGLFRKGLSPGQPFYAFDWQVYKSESS